LSSSLSLEKGKGNNNVVQKVADWELFLNRRKYYWCIPKFGALKKLSSNIAIAILDFLLLLLHNLVIALPIL